MHKNHRVFTYSTQVTHTHDTHKHPLYTQHDRRYHEACIHSTYTLARPNQTYPDTYMYTFYFKQPYILNPHASVYKGPRILVFLIHQIAKLVDIKFVGRQGCKHDTPHRPKSLHNITCIASIHIKYHAYLMLVPRSISIFLVSVYIFYVEPT